MENLLFVVAPILSQTNRVVWPFDHSFSISSCYVKLLQEKETRVLTNNIRLALRCIWKSLVLYKVKVFSWRLVQDRLSIRSQLASRGTLVHLLDKIYVFCLRENKNVEHVMLHCAVVRKI